jgi:hypothetical protein
MGSYIPCTTKLEHSNVNFHSLVNDYYNLGINANKTFHEFSDLVIELEKTEGIIQVQEFMDKLDKSKTQLKEFIDSHTPLDPKESECYNKQIDWIAFIKTKFDEYLSNRNKTNLLEVLHRSDELKTYSQFCLNRWKLIKTGKSFDHFIVKDDLEEIRISKKLKFVFLLFFCIFFNF